eukprot:5535909-Pyramimonas_sp.AAC.1
MGLADLLFESGTRLVSIDRHFSNLAAERRMRTRLFSRAPSMRSLLVPCRQHMLQGMRIKSTFLFEDCISFMVNLTLSLMSPGCLKVFRSCLELYLRKKIVVREGFNLRDVEARRHLILKWFIPSS